MYGSLPKLIQKKYQNQQNSQEKEEVQHFNINEYLLTFKKHFYFQLNIFLFKNDYKLKKLEILQIWM